MKTWHLLLALAAIVLFTPSAEAGGKPRKVQLTGVVNLNAAPARQLDLLPGVGEKAAAKIIAFREKTPFKRIEELVKVRGFGKKKFEKLKGYLTVAGPSTLAAAPASPDKPDKERSQARSSPNPPR